MEEITRIKGTNGTVIVYSDRVSISRKGFVGFVTQGLRGDRIIYYKDLNTVEYRKPSIWANGYIKFIIAGTDNKDAKAGLFGITTLDSSKDENTVILRAFNKNIPELSQQVYDILLKKISDNNKCIHNIEKTTFADEIFKYKELLDIGAISQVEYDNKKEELLNKTL